MMNIDHLSTITFEGNSVVNFNDNYANGNAYGRMIYIDNLSTIIRIYI